jgi:hypothetical protein
MKLTLFGALLILLCPSFSGAQAPNSQGAKGKSREVKLEGLSVRLDEPIQVTAQAGWHMKGSNFDGYSFIHLTPMLARFPKGELIATYALDPDTQRNPFFLSAFQLSKDGGERWGTRYGILMQHIPMIFVPEDPDSLIALPSELLGDKEAKGQNLRGPYLRFEQGGKRMVMEPDGVRVVNWPWPVQSNPNGQPESNWHYSLLFTGDAIRVKGQILATAYWRREREKVYANGLLSSKDGGHTWRHYSTIATAGDVLPPENWTQKGFEGPDETSMIRLAGGELMAVFRVGSGINWKLRRSYSSDDGRTWSKPEAISAYSVEPKLLRTANGTIVLASGRPGIGLWLSTDAKAQSWQYIDLVAIHNSFSDDQSYRIAPLDPEHPEKMWQTTSYTGLVELNKNRLLLAYDRDPERAPSGPDDLSRVFVMSIAVERK